MPTIVVPSVLAHNESIREAMIDALVNGSDTNWINEFHVIRPNISETDYSYDIPNITKPTCFGSIDSYAMSVYSQKQSRGTGIDWAFATFGSEEYISEYVYDMYTRKLPFVVNLYRCLYL